MADAADWLLPHWPSGFGMPRHVVGVVCGGLLFHGAGTVVADTLLVGGVAVGLCFAVLAVVLVA
jgi:hypothetical protein